MLMLSNGLDGLWLCRLFMLVWVILGSFCCCVGCLEFLVCWRLFSLVLGMCGVVFLHVSRCLRDCLKCFFKFVFGLLFDGYCTVFGWFLNLCFCVGVGKFLFRWLRLRWLLL